MAIDLQKLKEVEELYDKYLKERSEILDIIINRLIAINGGEEKYEFSYGGVVTISSTVEIEHHDEEATIKQIMSDMRKRSSHDDLEKHQEFIRESQIRRNKYSPDNPYCLESK